MRACSVMFDSLRPHGYSPLGSSVHGAPQARVLEGVAISFSRGSSRDPQRDQTRDQTKVSCVGRQILYHRVTWKKDQGAAKTRPTEVPPGTVHCLALTTLGFGCAVRTPGSGTPQRDSHSPWFWSLTTSSDGTAQKPDIKTISSIRKPRAHSELPQ